MINTANQNQEIADYIKKNVKKGYDMDSLKYSLIKQGYSRTSVEKGIEIAKKQLVTPVNGGLKVTPKMQVIDEGEIKRKMAEQDNSPGFFKRVFGKVFG